MDLLDFNVEREAWLYYTLSDASRFKFKLVLTQVAKSRTHVNPAGEPIYHYSSTSLFGLVSFPNELRKPPSTGNVTKKRLMKSLDEQVTFSLDTGQDTWNVYRFEDETVLKITPVLKSVLRMKLRGPIGEPIYTINSHQDFRLKVPSNLVKKP